MIRKLTISLLLLMTFQVSATGFAQKINIARKNVHLSEIFKTIEQQTEYFFFYDKALIDGTKPIDITLINATLEQALLECLKDQNLTYSIVKNSIVIQSKKGVAPQVAYAFNDNTLVPPIEIKGRIVNKAGEPLDGVSVFVAGTKKGTTTNNDGRFTMSVYEDAKVELEISIVGYETKKVSVGNQREINIVMEEMKTSMSDVVVMAYSSQPTREITGTLQKVSSKELGNAPVSTVGQMLQGRLSGVTINETTGRPGEGLRIRVRGAASLTAGSEPLYVVDGMPISGDISNIDFNQIESITVLKDAAATSLYGSRAANGVVLVQTKRGAPGRMQVGFNSFYGVNYVPEYRQLKMMNAREYAQFSKEVAQLNGRPVKPEFQNPDQYGEGTNWFDVITKTAPIQSHSLSMSGGSEKFTTSAMVGFLKQEGVVLGTGYQRFSLRINSDFKPLEKMNIGFNIAPAYSTNSNFDTDGDRGFIVGASVLTTPLASPYNPDGTLAMTATDPTKSHPNWLRVAKETVWQNKSLQLLSNAFLDYEIVKGLVARTSVNVEMVNSSLFKFFPSTVGNGLNNPPPRIPRGSDRHSQYYNWLNENTLNYKKEINGHSFDALVGFTSQQFRSRGNEIIGNNFPDDKIREVSAATQVSVTSDVQEWTLLSTLARLNYNYKGKYLLTASIRQDGSSRFGTKRRWGNFPSASAGWIISEENFWKFKPVSFLKVRVSYGTVGNFAIGNYSYMSTVGTANYVFANTQTVGRATNNLGDNSLGWEKSKEFNIGADVYLLNDRIQVMYNYYNKTSSDLLYNVQLPLSSGFSNMQTNIGELKFWGHDLLIQSSIINNKNFSWKANVNLTISRNKVMALGTRNETLISPDDKHITAVGQPIGMFYGTIWEGLYLNQADLDKSPKTSVSQVGTIKLQDINGDGIVTLADRTSIGSPWPDFTYGMTQNLKYKNIDFSLVVAGSYGNQVAARYEYTTSNLDASYNVLKEVANRWKSPENPGDGKYGSSQQGTTFVERDWFSSRFLRDGSFFAFKNIMLGYTIPLKPNKVLRNLRVYGSVQNAYLFSKYSGPNPEVSTLSSSTEQGIDDSAYPVPRTISIGLNISM